MTRCLVCGGPAGEPVIELPEVPVFCNVLWSDPLEARAAARGDLRLVYCPDCSHLYNEAFDPTRTEYGPDYENSLHFSPRFREYAEALADRLADRYPLAGGCVVDVGCGRGDFLRLICERADAHGVGFDRSHGSIPPPDARVRFVDAFIEADTPPMSVDLLSCRHVVEHLDDPLAYLKGLVRWLGPKSSAVIYLEVPNGAYTVMEGGIWDLIYEHASYFTLASLERLVRRSGLSPLESGTAFGGQYIYAEARAPFQSTPPLAPTTSPAAPSAPAGPAQTRARSSRAGSPPALAEAMVSFRHRYQERVERWRREIHRARVRGERLALWGSGSKGVTFLNLLDPGDTVAFVVDVNPRKHGRFVAGTGHPVVPPSALTDAPPDRVLITNPLYAAEISADLRERGLGAPVVEV